MATLQMADSADLTASGGYTPISLQGASQTAQPQQQPQQPPQQQPPQQQNFRPRFNVQQKETRQIGPIRIQSAVASFVFKGEDRFDMWRCTNYGDASSSSATTIIEDEHDFSDDDGKDYDDGNNSINSSSKPSSSSSKFKCKLDRAKKRYLLTSSPTPPPPAAASRAVTVLSPPISPARDDHISIGTPNRDNDGHHHQPQLLAYAGVFDGHSGPAASEYCANKGLLSHIVLETAAAAQSITTTTSSTNSSTPTRGYNRTTAWAIGGGGVHNKGPHIEVPWLSHHHHQNQQYTKTATAAATPAADDVGNINNSNHSNNNDDTTKDWCPIQNALQETVAKHVASPLEVAHARAFYQAQSRFAAGSTRLTLKQVAKQVIEMNRLQQQQQQRRNGGYYTRRGAAAASATAATAAGNSNVPSSSSPGFKGLLRRRHGSSDEREGGIPGGTTACTISIYCQEKEDDGDIVAFGEDDFDEHDDDDDARLAIFAVVANCGDSRLITDHATGGTHFHAITTDHRPSEPHEAVRLAECCKRGHGQLSCQRWTPATTHQGEVQWLHSPVERLFPGGLAVSRTIGDTSYCKSAVPVPDVYRVCLGSAISIPPSTMPPVNIASPPNRRALMMSSAKASTFAGSRRSVMSACTTSTADSTGAGHTRTHRFVLATDGLWDILSIQEVGVLAARQVQHGGAHDDEHDVLMGEEVLPHVSAARIMQECLAKCQEVGHFDDITILVMDVTV